LISIKSKVDLSTTMNLFTIMNQPVESSIKVSLVMNLLIKMDLDSISTDSKPTTTTTISTYSSLIHSIVDQSTTSTFIKPSTASTMGLNYS